MTSVLRLVGCWVVVSILAAPLARSQDGGGLAKENLDLPYDAIGANDDDEDAPEVVVFYGTSLEGDGFFYIIDRSGSMQDSGELQIAKREVIKNIGEFSDRVEFGIFFFDKTLLSYPPNGQPAEATPAGKSSGISYHCNCLLLGLRNHFRK